MFIMFCYLLIDLMASTLMLPWLPTIIKEMCEKDVSGFLEHLVSWLLELMILCLLVDPSCYSAICSYQNSWCL